MLLSNHSTLFLERIDLLLPSCSVQIRGARMVLAVDIQRMLLACHPTAFFDYLSLVLMVVLKVLVRMVY